MHPKVYAVTWIKKKHSSVVEQKENLTSNLFSISCLSLHDITVFFFVPVGFKHLEFILKGKTWYATYRI